MSFRPRSLIGVLSAALALTGFRPSAQMMVRSRETTSTEDAFEPYYLPWRGPGLSNGTNRKSRRTPRVKPLRTSRTKARKRARCKVRRRSHRRG